MGDLLSRQKGGKAFLTLEPGEVPLAPSPTHGASQVACLSASGRLLVFPLDELKLQPKGGRGLTLMDLDAKDSLAACVAFASTLRVLGSGRGGKAKDEALKGAALLGHVGKRARKGKAVDLAMKAHTLVPA